MSVDKGFTVKAWRYAKYGGKLLGLGGIGLTGYQYANGEISQTEATVDGIMGVIGMTGIGTLPAAAYFGVKAYHEITTGKRMYPEIIFPTRSIIND